MNRKVLIFGGTGILSADVCDRSLNEGDQVYILNRGTRKYKLDERAKLILCDIRSETVEEIRKKIEGLYFDVVIDFLSMDVSHVQKSLQIINGQCYQYIFISTATIYAKQNESEIITEETPIGNRKWDYSEKKVKCEAFVCNEYKNYCENYTIIRPYVTYSNMRIPFAIIPGYNWTLINRIMIGKPVVLWDHGQSICTITNTRDFAIGVVGLFTNKKAYREAFHITSNYSMTWKEVLEDIISATGANGEIADMPTDAIVRYLPEYAGVLYGDKSTNMIFDNSKITSAVPGYTCNITFKNGIKDTVEYYLAHSELQIIDYAWEGRIDWMLAQYFKNQPEILKKLNLKNYKNITVKEKLRYLVNRYQIFYKLHKLVIGLRKNRGKFYV